MRGIDRLRHHLKGYEDAYVIIGGTACTILFEAMGQTFRATDDFDIVLVAEGLDPESLLALRTLIAEGEYRACHRKDGKLIRYRFEKPNHPDFPKYIELFSHKSINLPDGQRIIPVETEDDLSRFSAILLDSAVYDFIRTHASVRDGIRTLEAPELIVLKAIAWCDNLRRRDAGEAVKSEDIEKHIRDIVRLLGIVLPGQRRIVPTGNCRESVCAIRDHLASMVVINVDGRPRATTALLGILARMYGDLAETSSVLEGDILEPKDE